MRHRFLPIPAAVFIALFARPEILLAQQPSSAPDEIFYNGKIVTVDTAFSTQQAFAVCWITT